MASLLQACQKFMRLALKTSIVENSDPVLKRLSDIREFDDRVKFAEEHWEKLGVGSARAVFKISDDLIIKIAINEKGIAQVKAEIQPEMQKSCVATIVVADPDGKWAISHFTETMTKEDFKRIVGVGFANFMACLFYAYNNESDRFGNKPKDYDAIKHLPLFKCVGQMVVDNGTLLGDIEKISSWGVRDDRVYVRDWGLTKQVYRSEYETDSSSESSPPKTPS
jgi:hypothetical protein